MKARYQLPTVNALMAVQAAYAAVSAVQTYTPGEQVAALAIALRVAAQHTGIGVGELLDKASRMDAHADTNYTREIRALREYIKNEVR